MKEFASKFFLTMCLITLIIIGCSKAPVIDRTSRLDSSKYFARLYQAGDAKGLAACTNPNGYLATKDRLVEVIKVHMTTEQGALGEITKIQFVSRKDDGWLVEFLAERKNGTKQFGTVLTSKVNGIWYFEGINFREWNPDQFPLQKRLQFDNG
jgi:hypothetical protein